MTVRQRPSCDEDHISSTAISIGAPPVLECVRDANGQALAYVYFEDELGKTLRRRTSTPATRPGASPPSQAA